MMGMRSRPWRKNPARKETSPLRVAFVITSMPVGGAETLLVNMMRRMDERFVTPEVVCMKEPGPLGETIARDFPVHSHLIRSKLDIAVLGRLAKLFAARRIDAVVTVGAGDKMFWGRLAAWLAGVPVIASALHSTGWPDGVGRANRLLTPITDAFIGVAESHGEFLESFEKFPPSKIHVIRNGVDCDRFRPEANAARLLREELALPIDSQLVGIVAALRSEKNHLMLVRSAAKMKDSHPNLNWVVVGDGPTRTEIESLADDLGVRDRVHLLGTRHDTPSILAGLDVFTLCSLNEASPVSILEALACQVPVVASDVGSISESVVENETGNLFPSEDEQAMVAAISRLLDHPEQRAVMGRAGRRLVVKTGSLQAMVDGYQRLVVDGYDRVATPIRVAELVSEAAHVRS